MGEVRATVLIENAEDLGLLRRGIVDADAVRRVNANMIVDTGAVVILLPQDMVEALGVEQLEKRVVTLADDRKVEMPIAGPLRLTIFRRTMNLDCLVGPPGCAPLLGQVVLESLDLIVDPAKRQLTVRPESPFLQIGRASCRE